MFKRITPKKVVMILLLALLPVAMMWLYQQGVMDPTILMVITVIAVIAAVVVLISALR